MTGMKVADDFSVNEMGRRAGPRHSNGHTNKVTERDLPTKESPILAILLLIAISLSLSSLPRQYGIARCKAGPKGLLPSKLNSMYTISRIGRRNALHPGVIGPILVNPTAHISVESVRIYRKLAKAHGHFHL